MRIINNSNNNNKSSTALVGYQSGNNNNNSSNNNNSRPVCAAEVFTLADALRKSRSVEFALPRSLAVAEVRLLYYLRSHGEFVKNQGGPEKAAISISDTVEAIRDLCTSPGSPSIRPTGNNNNARNSYSAAAASTKCVLTEDEIIQLVDLRVLTEVDLYKVIPDIDVRLGGEAKIAPLLSLLQQLK
jgi:hypothetical protein